jgi:hypothetical protein
MDIATHLSTALFLGNFFIVIQTERQFHLSETCHRAVVMFYSMLAPSPATRHALRLVDRIKGDTPRSMERLSVVYATAHLMLF